MVSQGYQYQENAQLVAWRKNEFDAGDDALFNVRRLRAQVRDLQTIIALPGQCRSCGDSDPFRVGKWGRATADEFLDVADLLKDRERLNALRNSNVIVDRKTWTIEVDGKRFTTAVGISLRECIDQAIAAEKGGGR